MKVKQKILLSAMGLVLATGIAISQPTVTPSGESLAIDGVEASNGAILRVVGPGGYRAFQEISADQSTIIDLKDSPLSIGEQQLSTLPAGAYRYELLSRPGGEIVRGTFNIGATDETASASTLDEQAQLETASLAADETIRVASEPESIYITDVDADGLTVLALESDSPVANQNWKLYNDEGIFKLRLYDGTSETDKLIVAKNGNVNITEGDLNVDGEVTTGGAVGIGTSNPLFALEISHNLPTITLSDTDGGTGWKLANDAGRFSLTQVSGLRDVVVVEEGSLANSLVIDSSGVSVLSSRATKSNIKPTSAEQVLAELDKLPIYTWNYTEDKNKALHIGPMAEDFHQQFGYGGDAKRISPLDTGGLALAGVKALQEELNKRDAEIAELKTTVALLLERSKK